MNQTGDNSILENGGRWTTSILRGLLVLGLSAPALVLLPIPPAHAAAPANDDLADATVIPSIPFTDMVDTREATTEPDDPDCFGTGPTVWYAYTPSSDVRLVADTFGSNYDTTLSVYTYPPSSDIQIACNLDAGDTFQSAVVFDAVAGETYYFMVGAWASGPGGDLVFNLGLAPPPLELEIEVDPKGTVDRHAGVAYISGTVFCSSPTFVDVFGDLKQRVLGHLAIEGWFYTGVACDGLTEWTVAVSAHNGFFKGGKAVVQASAFACDAYECYFVSTEETSIQLTGGGGN